MTLYTGWYSAIITIATDAAKTPELDLGRDYEFLDILIPTIDSANVSFQVAETSGGTFYALGSGSKVIAAGTGVFATTIRLGGYRYIKVVTSANQTTGNVTFKVRGWRM